MSGNQFDLQLICAGMTADSLATDLLDRARTLADFRVHSDDSNPPRQFEIVRFTAKYVYAAAFYLCRGQLLVMFITHPKSPTIERAMVCDRAFQPLFSLIQSSTGAQPILWPASPDEGSNACVERAVGHALDLWLNDHNAVISSQL